MKNPPTPADTPTNRRISKLALIGTILLPFGFLFIPVYQSSGVSSPTTWQILLRYAVLTLAFIIPFASTALGFVSISQIRNSNGAIYGMPLAVFVSLFYPIILLDLILVFLGWTFLGTLARSSLIPLAWFFLILLIDYLLIRYTWRTVNQ